MGAELRHQQVVALEEQTRVKEADLRAEVELLRLTIQAFGAALAEFRSRQKLQDLAPVKGAQQPGNEYDRTLIIETFSKGVPGATQCMSPLRRVQELAVPQIIPQRPR